MYMKKFKTVLVATAFSIFSVSMLKSDYVYQPQYEILTEVDNDAFASYQNGLIYIGDSSFINSLDHVNENDIIVMDNRNTDKSSIQVVSSYEITDKDVRNDIICVIDEYLKLYPSDFNRSIESMRLEWLVHNILYGVNYEVDRTRDVDFETSEEDLYSNYVLTKLFNL